MRTLFISPRQAWPAAGGAKIREYHFARALGEQGPLTYVYFREPAFDAPKLADMPFCAELIPVDPPERYSPARLVRGLVSRWPLPVLNYTSQAMSDTVGRLLAIGSYDVVHLDSTHLAAYAPLVRRTQPNASVMFDWHNIESEGMERYAELTPSPLKRAYAKQTARKMKAVELELIRSDSHHVVCSERERRQLTSLTPGNSRVAVVENGVATEAFDRFTPVGMAGNRILFVGLMAYHANVDAVVWFAREVWPALRAKFPDKIFTVVGANPVPAVLDLRSQPGVEVTGTVEDVKPFYASAFAAVAPLRTGAGTRLKILEAMAARVPVISTALGAEGLDVADKEQLLLAETPDEWVNAASALQNAATYESLSRNGYELVKTRYDWQLIRNTLAVTYKGWLRTRIRQ